MLSVVNKGGISLTVANSRLRMWKSWEQDSVRGSITAVFDRVTFPVTIDNQSLASRIFPAFHWTSHDLAGLEEICEMGTGTLSSRVSFNVPFFGVLNSCSTRMDTSRQVQYSHFEKVMRKLKLGCTMSVDLYPCVVKGILRKVLAPNHKVRIVGPTISSLIATSTHTHIEEFCGPSSKLRSPEVKPEALTEILKGLDWPIEYAPADHEECLFELRLIADHVALQRVLYETAINNIAHVRHGIQASMQVASQLTSN